MNNLPENFEITKITQNNKEISIDWTAPFKKSFLKQPFEFEIKLGERTYAGAGSWGDEALWFPIDQTQGIKLINSANPQQVYENIKYIQQINSPIFPTVFWASHLHMNDTDCIIALLENVEQKRENVAGGSERWLPSYDRSFVESTLQNPIRDLDLCTREFIKHQLLPEDDWYKSVTKKNFAKNMFNGKIVDFHNITKKVNRYQFPSSGTTVVEADKIYKSCVEQYKKWVDIGTDGLPKWKGKIYQGFKFANGYDMIGYSSDNIEYDSYIKLPFVPFNKVAGKKVLDLGSNQGFLTLQAVIHGAEEAIGVELVEEDVNTANAIKSIAKLDNATFYNTDAVKFIDETEDFYELIILNSVLHQIYPNFVGASAFMDNIADKCNYFVFETPVNHKKMNIPLEKIYEHLEDYFELVRLVYIYDAYSSGYRANFICYSYNLWNK